MCKIPTSILTGIRRKIFHFIWTGNHSQKFHLIDWERLARPVELGGWAIKNIHIFSSALLAKSLWRSLWRVLSEDNLWILVIKKKYFRSLSMTYWIRTSHKSKNGISNNWVVLLSSFDNIKNWLAWLLRNGQSIQIGEDPIIGGPISYRLSLELIHHLRARGIYTLHHIHHRGSTRGDIGRWIYVGPLGLYGEMALEWATYVKDLYKENIHLMECPDLIQWSWSLADG